MAEITHGFVGSLACCGRVVFLSVDDPSMSKADRRDLEQRIGEMVAGGVRVERLPDDEVRAAAARFGAACDACAPKPKAATQLALAGVDHGAAP